MLHCHIDTLPDRQLYTASCVYSLSQSLQIDPRALVYSVIAEEISADILLVQLETRLNIYFRYVAFQIFGNNTNTTKLKRMSYK